MKYEDYREIYADALKLDDDFETVILPVEIEEGETQEEAFLRFLLNEDLVEVDEEHWRIKDRGRINEYNPNLLKVLDAMIMASVMAEMDSLIEMGYVYMTVDEEGNIIYELTETGLAYTEDD